MPGRRHIWTFISWLRVVVRTIAVRSYTDILSALLRLIRYCYVVINGPEKGRTYRERGLALSSQANEQDKLTASVTLAVPILQAPLCSEGCQLGTDIHSPTPALDEGSHAVAFKNQAPQNACSPLIPSSGSEHGIYTTPPQCPVPGQSLDTTLMPITPRQIGRYDRKVKIRNEYVMFEIEKGPFDCSEDLAPVAGWEPLTHPDGALFFYHPYKRIFTDADIRDPAIATRMGKAAEKAYEEARNAGIVLHPSVELALEFMDEDNRYIGYYFVDHDRRVIFWFEAHESHYVIFGVRGVEHKSHVRYALESQYWKFVEQYPNKRFLPKDVIVRLKEVVMHAHAEYITDEKSVSPFASDETASILSLMDLLMSSINKEHEHSIRIVARCMKRITRANFRNFSGQPIARLDAEQSLYGDLNTRSKTILFRVMDLIMFGSPDAHGKALHMIRDDSSIIQMRRYRNFIDSLNGEWNGYTIFSTVMLAVDISFLAVPIVQTQTFAILISYLSTLCAVGSLVVTLGFARQVYDSQRYPHRRLASFMFRMTSSTDRLALMLSLPFAFLIWGAIFFAAALSIVIFRTSDTLIISIVYPIWAAIVILATWPALVSHISTLKSWMKGCVLRLKRYFNFGLSGITAGSRV